MQDEQAMSSKPSKDELRKKLSPMQYHVTQEQGTEPPFRNEYRYEHREGIYVDIVSWEPLFTSIDEFESGCGWPSFTRPIRKDEIIERRDTSHHMGPGLKKQSPESRSRNCVIY